MPKFEYSCMEDFVIKNGRWFTPSPLPKKIRSGQIKECFKNALMTSFEYDLTYVEGFAVADKCPIPIYHAFCVKDNKVIDPTWCETLVGDFYFGVPFNKKYLNKLVSKGFYCVIDDWKNRWPLLRGKKGWELNETRRPC